MKKLSITITTLAMAGAAQVASASNFCVAVNDLGPVGYWQFEDDGTDRSGNGNTLTPFGPSSGYDDGPALPGLPGRAFSVQHDGGQSGASVALGEGNPLNMAGATAYTINVWVKNRDKYNQRNNGFLAVNRDTTWRASSGANYGLSTSHEAGGRMRAWSSANYNRREFSPLTGYSHDWQMLTATITLNGGSADFYINGAFIGSDPSALHGNITSISGDGVVFAVGNRCDGSNECGSDDYDGLIDELAVFNYALNETQISNLYAAAFVAGGPCPEPGLIPSVDVVVEDVLGTSFPSSPNLTYSLQSTPDLVSSNFSDTGAIAIGNGDDLTLYDPTGPSTSKNYRVKLLQ